MSVPVCQALYDKIRSMESVPLGPGSVTGGRSGSIRDVKVLAESVDLGNGSSYFYSLLSDSEKEFYYYLFRYGSLFVCLVLIVLYLIYHESL